MFMFVCFEEVEKKDASSDEEKMAEEVSLNIKNYLFSFTSLCVCVCVCVCVRTFSFLQTEQNYKLEEIFFWR